MGQMYNWARNNVKTESYMEGWMRSHENHSIFSLKFWYVCDKKSILGREIKVLSIGGETKSNTERTRQLWDFMITHALSRLTSSNNSNGIAHLKQNYNRYSNLSSWTIGHYFREPLYKFTSLLTHMHSLVWIIHVSVDVIGGGLQLRLFGCCQLG